MSQLVPPITLAEYDLDADHAEVAPLWDILRQRVEAYLDDDSQQRVARAYAAGVRAHAGQRRRSGEAYFTHPIAVATILAEQHLDADTLCAALLHDAIEDTPFKRAQISAEFGETIAHLVDGVTKLDKLKDQSRQEANAESFTKMMMAMARDLRVILIKLADRLHNMRTIDAMSAESRRRIAHETLEIYAPIAQRLGMNRIKADLQDLGFATLYPRRHRILENRLQQTYGDRADRMAQIQQTITAKLDLNQVGGRVVARVKSPYSIYSKMKSEHKSLQEVLDVYGVRVVVQEPMQCYMALGVVHSLFKPKDGRFRDFIAHPKSNGYQSLHTVLVGPSSTPIEVQIRTEAMDQLAERGIAAHWSYKTDGSVGNSAQARAREWLSGLVDAQQRAANSIEFVEHVKVDLFPDDVYVFSPKGLILSLPRQSTALDFAYAVHTFVGDHAVAARIDGRLSPLKSRLETGQTVEIITATSAQPQIGWLEFVVTSKARSAIRHALKQMQHEDSVEIGHRLLDRALEALSSSIEQIPVATLDAYLKDHRLRRLEDLLADIAFGNRMPQQVARSLVQHEGQPGEGLALVASERLQITGSERGVLSFANCCHPLPGEEITGFLSAGKGIVVHLQDCPNVPELRKTPERCVSIEWAREVTGDFKVALRVVVDNKPGVLATVAAAIGGTLSNIDTVEYQERDLRTASMLFVIEVKHRKHLATVIRRLRREPVVHSVARFIG